MMKAIVFLLTMIPYLTMAQCDPAGMGLLSAEVHGDTVVLKNDTAYRNCGALYTMGVTNTGNDTLTWLQTDTGDVAYCYCNFDLSVTLDSLSPGDYIVKVFYTDLVYNDTCYIGLVPFTISQPENYPAPKIIHHWQSGCFTIGMEDNQDFSELWTDIYPNPAGDILFIRNMLNTKGSAQIFNINGQLQISTALENQLTSLNITNLKTGIYLVKILNEDHLSTYRLIKR
ncbi:MAG: T9SS type A sorting domain-containing protein [Lentimicrobium sp.]|nr:T9SS type A sorting domain-containing protein [Lentimicrobium sp.]